MVNIKELVLLTGTWGGRLKIIEITQKEFCDAISKGEKTKVATSTLNGAIKGRSDPRISMVCKIESGLQKMEARYKEERLRRF